MITTLDKMSTHQIGIIINIKESRTTVSQRLMEIGFIDGVELEVLGFAPMGDPMRVRIYESNIMLRKSEASFIEVEII